MTQKNIWVKVNLVGRTETEFGDIILGQPWFRKTVTDLGSEDHRFGLHLASTCAKGNLGKTLNSTFLLVTEVGTSVRQWSCQ